MQFTYLYDICRAPNVFFQDDNAINLESELMRSRRIKCSFCGIKGAALGCYEKSCRKSFHVPCAKKTPECRWDYVRMLIQLSKTLHLKYAILTILFFLQDNFVMLCPLHASSKLLSEVHISQSNLKRKSVLQRYFTFFPSF
jgi:BRCA1-associated RING domain protein 1